MDKESLKKPRLREEEIELEGVGTIRVRALNRAEVLKVNNVKMPITKMEQLLLSMAMVDPAMSEEDVKEWQEASGAGEIEKVTEVVQRLSGLVKGADKSDVSYDGERSEL